MFTNGALTIQYAAEQIQRAEDAISFKHAIYDLKKCLIELGADSENLMQIEQIAYYLPNNYSEMDTKDKIEQAKKRVLEKKVANKKIHIIIHQPKIL